MIFIHNRYTDQYIGYLNETLHSIPVEPILPRIEVIWNGSKNIIILYNIDSVGDLYVNDYVEV